MDVLLYSSDLLNSAWQPPFLIPENSTAKTSTADLS